MRNKKNIISQKTIEKIFRKALKKLYTKDYQLISEYNVDKDLYGYVHERSIVFRFGIYFNNLCKKHRKLRHYDVDCEYNKDVFECKRIDNEIIIPDFIVHKRRNNENNLLVVEFKGWWVKDKNKLEEDKKKVENIKEKYHYKYAYTCVFAKESYTECLKTLDRF